MEVSQRIRCYSQMQRIIKTHRNKRILDQVTPTPALRLSLKLESYIS